MQTHDEHGRRRVDRRTLLAGAAGLGLLAGCKHKNASSTRATCLSELKITDSRRKAESGEIRSKIAGVPSAWTHYPAPYETIPTTPGHGGDVTTFQILYSTPPPSLGNNPWWQELNKRLGVQIKPTLAASPDYGNKLATLAASGDFPDITYLNFGAGGSSGGADAQRVLTQGAFHDLTDYLTGTGLRDFPNLARIASPTWKGSSFQGKIFGVPYPIQPVNGFLGMYRRDWAQKLGVDNPKNADEVLRMFTAMSTGDPDGNGQRNTYGLDTLRIGIWTAMFRAPNNWRRNDDGTLTKDFETEEYAAALEFTNKLWRAGAVHPDALTLNLAQTENYLQSGKTGFFSQGGWAFFGDQPNTDAALTKKNFPHADPAPWLPPGHDGGQPAMPLGSASYGFAAIPSSIKDEKRIVELLHIIEYWAAPFGSKEFTFMQSGIEGKMFHFSHGAPVSNGGGSRNWPNGLNYLCLPGEVNYFYADQPGFARTMQQLQERQITHSVADPTQGLYSPTWVSSSGILTKLQSDTANDIAVGRKPMSALKDAITSWKNQGGEKARNEFQDALQRCS